MRVQPGIEHVNTVVIGAGQAGLSVGYHLQRLGVPFVILDASARVGDVWRRRWDSLRLFTPARYSGLDGMPFPAQAWHFPTKDEMGDFLESYAAHYQLPIRLQTRVDRVSRQGEVFVVVAGDRRFEAQNVVVAMAHYQRPRIPPVAGELDPAIVQVHSLDYRNLKQLQPGGVLVVGAGNSGAEIALEAAPRHETWLAGRDTGHLPFQLHGAPARLLVPLVLRVLFHRILTVNTPFGRSARAAALHHGGPLIRLRPADLAAAGVHRVPRLAATRNGKPMLDDGRVLDVANVVWCTGFHPGFSWIDVPVFERDGEPRHDAGIVPGAPGLFFVGLHFLYAMSSTMIHGVGRDAARIAAHVEARARAAGGPSPAARHAA